MFSQRRRARRENIGWFLTKNTDPSFAYLEPWREIIKPLLLPGRKARKVFTQIVVRQPLRSQRLCES